MTDMEMVVGVIDGRVGASLVVEVIQQEVDWPRIVRWLYENKYVGKKLVEFYGDSFCGCGELFNTYIREEIAKDAERIKRRKHNSWFLERFQSRQRRSAGADSKSQSQLQGVEG